MPILFLLAAAMLVAGFVVSTGLFTIDEIIYVAGSRAILEHASFAVPNGWPEFNSEDIRLWLLVAGPHGLAPQYPVGHAVIGAPFMWLFGQRGLLLLNVCAGIGLLFATRALAERLCADRGAALLAVALLCGATFWFEYVYAVWPHVPAMLCVTLALICVLDCLDADSGFEIKALAAGAALGAGFLFRTDTVLAIPAIGIISLLYAKHPIRLLTFFGLGFLPFLCLASVSNLAKFGTLNPLSYGQQGKTATSLGAHVAAIAALMVMSLLLLCWRFLGWRPGKRQFVFGLVAVVAVLAVSDVARDLLYNYLFGAWALVADATAIGDGRRGIEAQPGGVLSFWGYPKKALGQSMPWLGLVLLAFHQGADGKARRAQLVVLIFAAIWMLPFFLKAWHGGMGSNMRYFLPVIPAICAIGAKLLIDLARSFANPQRILLAGGLCGFVAVIGWAVLHPTHLPGAEQILSTWLFLAIAAVALVSGIRWAGQAWTRGLCLAAIGAGLAASLIFLGADFLASQRARASDQELSTELAGLPDHALVYAPARFLADWAFEPGHVAALPGLADGRFDDALIDAALARGYRVLVWPGYVNPGLRNRYGSRLRDSGVTYSGGEFLEVMPGGA